MRKLTEEEKQKLKERVQEASTHRTDRILDDESEEEVVPGGTADFPDVSEGVHILRAEVSGFESREESIQVDRDVIWTIEER